MCCNENIFRNKSRAYTRTLIEITKIPRYLVTVATIWLRLHRIFPDTAVFVSELLYLERHISATYALTSAINREQIRTHGVYCNNYIYYPVDFSKPLPEGFSQQNKNDNNYCYRNTRRVAPADKSRTRPSPTPYVILIRFVTVFRAFFYCILLYIFNFSTFVR